jgi:hypothetical protein
MRYVPPKSKSTFNGLYGITSQQISLFIFFCTSLSIQHRENISNKLYKNSTILHHMHKFEKDFKEGILQTSRSWSPRGLRNELSSIARTLGSWVRIPLKAWMSVYAFILCSCCPVCRQRLPSVSKRLRNWRRGQGPTKGCPATDEWMKYSKRWHKNLISVHTGQVELRHYKTRITSAFQ